MKYQRLVSNTTPSSLQDWLEEELESRGIDGVYTRYILSLLQQDYLDLEPAECQHTTLTGHQRKKCDEFGCKDYVLSFSKARHQKWKNWEKERLLGLSTSCCGLDLSSNLEERNKIAAVECLKSASEEKFGIEKLIDEVCIKLKNVKTTSEKAKAEEEESDYVDKEPEEIPPSSPKDPAEKYYEAFPALNGKTEPMTELCQEKQQNKADALEGVWNGRLMKDSVNQKAEQNDTDGSSITEEISENTPSENWRENSLETQNCTLREFKIIDQEDNIKDEGRATEPSFIVPKVKTSLVRKPFSTGYLPFNQLRKHAQDSAYSKDTGEVECPSEMSEPPNKVLKEVNGKEEKQSNSVNGSSSLFPGKKDQESKDVKKDFISGSEEARAFESLFENFCDCEKLGILMYAALTDVSNSDLCADEKDKFSVEQLLSKFNSSLASIWKSNGHNTNQKDFIGSENREHVLKLSSDESYSMVYDESVWACNKEEIERKNKAKLPITSGTSRVSKVLSSKENNELYSPVGDIKPLPRNEQKISTESLSKEAEPFLDSENKENSENSCSSKQMLQASSQESLDGESEIVDKIGDSLNSYPDQFSPGVENFDEARHLANIGSERGNASPKSDEIHSVSSMWKPQDTSHMLDQNLKKIWDPSPLGESSNWLAIPVKNDVHHRTDWESKEFFKLPSHSDVQAHWNQKCEQEEKDKNESLCRAKCTLTYHKGESKFVEVVPSHKQKSAILEDSLDTIESSALFQSDSALSNIGYLSDEEYEEEENLLTSPKTHFQPIRHDSLDTDNSDDLEVMMLTRSAVGCTPVSQESVVDLNPADFVSTLPADKGNSPKKCCHIELKKIRGKRISPKNFSTNQLTSPVKEAKRGRTISSSFDELVSLTGRVSSHDYSGIELTSQNTNALNLLSFHFWKADNFKDKGTNTDTSLCMGPDGFAKQGTSCWEESSESIACFPEKNFGKEFFSPEIKIWQGSEEISKTPGRKRTVSKWKWSTNDDNNNMEDIKWFPSPYPEWNGLCEPKTKALLKAFGSNTDINALRQEIKEEEEELFRNISYLDSSCVKDEIDIPSENKNCDFFFGRSGRRYESEKALDKRGELFADVSEASLLIQSGFLEWSSSDDSFSDPMLRDIYDRSFSLGDLDMDDGEHPFPAVPADKILYSSDLEDEWRKTSQSFRIQAPHKRTKYKYPPQKRPCSFYLEGNCRRSDCRFSHDLSTITCRFWEEGTCFKGVTCPFLHGYICDMSFSERNSTPDCKYTLESEADFPSLSASKNEAPLEKSVPQEITLDKGNRPKRKKGKSQSSWNPKKATQPAVSSSWPGCKSFMKTLECSPE